MWNATIKGLLAHKLRFALTGLAVMLGVAFVAGTFVFTDTIGATFDDLLGTDTQSDAVVRAAADDREVPPAVPTADTLDTVRGVEGVAVAEPDIFGYAELVTDGSSGGGFPIAEAWPQSDELNPYRLVEGSAPTAAGHIAIDRGSAESSGLGVGDTVQVALQTGPQQFEVTGIVTYGEVDSPLGASILLFDLDTASEILGAPGEYSGISAVAAAGVGQDELAERIGAALPAGFEVVTGEEFREENEAGIAEGLGFINTFLLVFAVISLFVGSFIIFNTFSIVVAQRTKEMALLRALGAGRGAVLRSVLVEALVVGLLASAVGVLAGVGLALGLQRLLGALLFELPTGAPVLAARTVAVSVAIGVVVTVLSAILPARRASRVPPVAAMREVAVDTADRSALRIVFGAVVTLAGAALLSLGLFAATGQPLPLVGIGAAGMFLGIAVLGPVLAPPVARLLGAPLPRLRGVAGTLATQNALRNPKRTAATASALMIGVALVSFVTILGSSARASVNGQIDDALGADFVLGTEMFTPISRSVQEGVAALPDVAAVSGFNVDTADIDGEPVSIAAMDTTTVAEVLTLDVEDGSLADVGETGLAVGRTLAEDRGWAVGDTVPVTFARTGTQDLTIAAIYAQESTPAGALLVDTATYDANYPDPVDYAVYVRVADGADLAQVRAGIEEVAAATAPAVTIQDQTEFKQAQSQAIGTVLNLLYGLLFLAVVIALIGIANTLALSVFERTRELGLLRAIGMSRQQLRSTVRWESVIIALFGTGLGLALGLFFGWAVMRALAEEGLDRLVIPGGQLALMVLVASLAGVLAAIGPARRAARLDVLQAIATE